ncbi:hypothetical protein DU55_08135 [Methanosarcina mazei]|uniref:Uncharacterized protein n=1 Tax=Methanosarcina mazei TaxID=2209 RepID=A0A0F8K5E5_METMZ|nr:hypothetical protein DU55_08135 [Methanosarcina mazei]
MEKEFLDCPRFKAIIAINKGILALKENKSSPIEQRVGRHHSIDMQCVLLDVKTDPVSYIRTFKCKTRYQDFEPEGSTLGYCIGENFLECPRFKAKVMTQIIPELDGHASN